MAWFWKASVKYHSRDHVHKSFEWFSTKDRYWVGGKESIVVLFFISHAFYFLLPRPETIPPASLLDSKQAECDVFPYVMMSLVQNRMAPQDTEAFKDLLIPFLYHRGAIKCDYSLSSLNTSHLTTKNTENSSYLRATLDQSRQIVNADWQQRLYMFKNAKL